MTKTEAQTRKELIDRKLLQSGWNVADRTLVVEEYDIELTGDIIKDPKNPYSGHQFSDYVLLGRNGKPLAVVEAKKFTLLHPEGIRGIFHPDEIDEIINLANKLVA